MMRLYESTIMVDIGNNPDRLRPGRQWLQDTYRVHQRLSMAFPSREQLPPDAFQPNNPQALKHSLFLYRVDYSLEPDCPRAIILVRSHYQPDWERAFRNASGFLAAPPTVRPEEPRFAVGDQLRYRIHVNLIRKSLAHRKTSNRLDDKGRPKSQSKRVPLSWSSEEGERPDVVIRDWFAARGKRAGFLLDECCLLRLGQVRVRRVRPDGGRTDPQNHLAALLEGALTVKDSDLFNAAVAHGIGSAKAFGLGLLTVRER